MSPDDLKAIQKMLSPTANRSKLGTARGSINTVRDSGGIQTAQITLLEDETRDRIERLQEYGFSSNPPAGSDAAVIFIGGNRDHGLIVAAESREHRKKNLESGEVCLYDKNGSEIYLKKNKEILVKSDSKVKIETTTGSIESSPASAKITVLGTVLEVSAAGVTITVGGIQTTIGASGISTQGGISDSAGSIAAIRAAHNTHTHPTTGLPPAPTAPPNGTI